MRDNTGIDTASRRYVATPCDSVWDALDTHLAGVHLPST